VRGLKPLLWRTIVFTLWIEGAGALLLALRLRLTHGYEWSKALAHGIFHSVSAFCNAGFALHETSLVQWRHDPAILLIVSALIVLGGLGFLVLFNLSSIRFWTRDRVQRGRLTLHSKIVLLTSGVLILAGGAAFLALEQGHTLHGLDWPDRLSCALLQSITPRTAGFNVVEIAAVKPATRFMTVLLMFIGGSPASTAGGVKTTTMVVLMLTVYAMISSREDTEALHRTIPAKIVREAISIFMLGVLCVVVFFTALLITEDAALLSLDLATPYDVFFETVSAFGTVGLSTGVTPQLSSAGRLLVTVCMFVGRLGPLTLALVIGTRDTRTQPIRYPEEEVVVG
jgi:trk system potassium uptake protein TrkH